jgi:UDP-galactopyranose mutase
LADAEKRVVFGGRLGSYGYFDMDNTIVKSLALAKKELA